MALLEVTDAAFSYKENEIFKELSFTVNRGEIFCLLGPNGCGKTTLLDCILGIHKIIDGQILLDGKNTSCLRSGELARHIAYVPQYHERTFPYTVLDIVKMGRAAYTGRFSAPSRLDIKIAEESLERVGLLRLRNRPYTQLSGGEGQLVMIARALAQRTPVIVMDEPTAHLDFKHEMIVLETIVHLVHNNSLTIIMATHFPNHAFYFENNRIKTTAALMHNKRFLEIGSPLEVLCESNMQKLYNVNTRLISCWLDDHSELRQLIPVSTVV
ncbi:MAG: ABC transporter ATP-binding protein [Syntrophomonadaceae bacterium]|nr:ABC transporter ATP-binding protein [Syntrophomonadaceae bacterium]MDD4550545.1 ABC transporter ATP-binding protein [Syntrophomonadaceae bacterium]